MTKMEYRDKAIAIILKVLPYYNEKMIKTTFFKYRTAYHKDLSLKEVFKIIIDKEQLLFQTFIMDLHHKRSPLDRKEFKALLNKVDYLNDRQINSLLNRVLLARANKAFIKNNLNLEKL